MKNAQIAKMLKLFAAFIMLERPT